MAKSRKSSWLNRKNKRLHLLLVAILPVLLYANTLGHDFALDDSIVITENMFTTEGISGWGGILGKDTFYGFFKEEGKARLVSGGRYRPLSLMWFALIWELFGSSAFVFHLFNILLYSACCLLLYTVLKRLLSSFPAISRAGPLALATTILFIAHPVHTEVVANIKGADEIFSLGFSLLALLFAFKYDKEQKAKHIFLLSLFFFLALMSKENAIPWLAVIPAALYFGRAGSKSMGWTAVFLGIALAAYLGIRFAVLGFGPASEPPMELMNNPFLKVEGAQYVPLDAGERWATIFYSLGYYLRLLFFPHPLVHDYYPRQIPIMNFGDPLVWLSLLAYLGIGIMAVFGWRKKKTMSFAAFYFIATLSIVSNIVFPVGTNLSERFLFAPSLAFCLFLAWLIWRKGGERWGQRLSLALLVAITLLYCFKTFDRNYVWKDNFTLFTSDVKYAPRSAKLLNAVGGTLLEDLPTSGLSAEEIKSQAQEAESYLARALQIHPNYKNALLLMGNAHFYQEEYEQAINYYNKTLQIDPDYGDALNNKFLAFRNGGRHYGEKKGDLDKSIEMLESAVKMRPDDYETNRLLGVAYGLTGKLPQAIRHFEKAVEIKPGDAATWLNLAKAYANAGHQEAAQEAFRKVGQLDPKLLEDQ